MPRGSTKRSRSPAAGQAQMVKAMSHPLRMLILARLNGNVASPRELSETLDATLGAISYHVRVLRDLELIELVKTRQRRGATEHFYRALARPMLDDDAVRLLPESVRGSLAATVINEIVADANGALASGDFESREDAHVSRFPLVLDEAGWAEARDLLADTLDALFRVQADAGARLAADGVESVSAEAAMLLFPTAAPRPAR